VAIVAVVVACERGLGLICVWVLFYGHVLKFTVMARRALGMELLQLHTMRGFLRIRAFLGFVQKH
jgi:hypothetical protein